MSMVIKLSPQQSWGEKGAPRFVNEKTEHKCQSER